MAEFERFGQRKGNNELDEQDDVDDFTFLNYSKQGGKSLHNGRQEQIADEMRRIEERTILSSERSLGLVHDSEKIGIATAEELVHQREQLQNSEAKVDDINRTLRTTQKHINSIKSLFGGIKNYFSKSPDQPRLSTGTTTDTSERKLESVIENSKNEFSSKQNYVHPGLRTRGLDSPDWEEDDDDRQFLQTPASKSKTSRYQQLQTRLDNNIDEMSMGIGRLKSLALELGNEVDDQDELIGRLAEKTDKAGFGIGRQTKQMRQIK